MGKYHCKCGNVLSNHRIPNDVELIVYTSKEWEVIDEINSVDYMPLPTHQVWHCKICDRIYVFKGSKLIKTYCVEV